ncbi:hypothetical protein [Embleya sp. NPDC020630]
MTWPWWIAAGVGALVLLLYAGIAYALWYARRESLADYRAHIARRRTR